jgi:hypothetical protein
MNLRALHPTQVFAAAVFVAATLVLAIQLITPSPVVVTIGRNSTNVAELGNYFRYQEVAIIAVSACLFGGSGTYLLTGDFSNTESSTLSREPGSDTSHHNDYQPTDELLEARRQEWNETAERLANNEEAIYEALLDADGVLPQSELVEQTDLSKATVSRTLDSLETKNLVERKRRGMGNMVLLL